MKTKLFTGLAVAASLLIAQPAFAYHKGGGAVASRGHAVAAVHRGGGMRVASTHFRASRAVATSRVRASNSAAIASRGSYGAPAARGYTATRSVRGSSQANFAFGGSSNNKGGFHGTYAFASHSGWSHDREYTWNGHHYRWYNNGWFIIDAYPYGYGDYGPDNGYYGYGADEPVSVQVQAALQQQGYYHGPIDGVVGPGTQAAIAAYQQDNGLRVTGTITHGLLNNLGVG
jgi:hypothetical protein